MKISNMLKNILWKKMSMKYHKTLKSRQIKDMSLYKKCRKDF